ncbi:hypothetical protein D9619_011913 [Psilocybe cf. subviscida]|uniref:Ubinuclein middle domain-containing protein n=1 Tax=Psilocybe cf. subviscida TaxID=2480587 RepID=A0A8H5B0V4_9AGAR|nr:hypothetical protein D9619_011913 [Psilocybe cf. subviscida]
MAGSDVDMDGNEARPSSLTPELGLTPPPTSPSQATSRRSSLAAGNGISINQGDSHAGGISIPLLVHSPSPSTTTKGTPHQDPGEASSTQTPQQIALSSASKPASSAAAAKPRSSKVSKARSPSPSPPPAPPVVPLQTIRLSIQLGGPSNYEVDIARQAKETGQRPPTPPLPEKKVADSSDSEEDEDEPQQPKADGDNKGAAKKKTRRKRNNAAEYYDTADPFIDDSELALDQRQYFAQTKQQGFYVSSGEVALLKDKADLFSDRGDDGGIPKMEIVQISSAPSTFGASCCVDIVLCTVCRPDRTKKPKSKKISFAAGLHPSLSQSNALSAPVEGTRDAPIPVDGPATSISAAPNGINGSSNINSSISAPPRSNAATNANANGPPPINTDVDDSHAGQKRKRQTLMTMENGKKRKVVDETMFHPDLQAAIKDIRALVASENWENKGKFPPSLKPPLTRLAILAIRLDEYDDAFFALMPSIFPYNKFTMTKLIKRTVFTDHLGLLQERQEVLLGQLKVLVDEGWTKAQEEWERSVAAWERRQEKLRAEASGDGASGTGSGAPTRQATEEMDVEAPAPSQAAANDHDKDGEDGKDGGGKDNANHPPNKRYRLTEAMRNIIWELVLLSNECCRLENEKNSLEGSGVLISDQGLRKVLYQKIVASYPEGWMSSGQISRDVSAIKKRLEREALEAENDD